MVFGVFDNFHQGHNFFLSKARKLCEKLVVVLATENVAVSLKMKKPRQNYHARFSVIKNTFKNVTITPSDEIIGSWQVLEKFKPDVALLGYDQKEIGRELKKRGQHSIFLKSF